jgi:hypothetical protein
LLEVDVTEARQFIRERAALTGETLSFSGYIISCIIRAVNRKSFLEIHDEIRQIRTKSAGRLQDSRKKTRRLFLAMPAFIRRIFYRVAIRNPGWIKRNVGTVALAAIGMFGEGGGWGIPIAVTPLFITLGGIAAKPGAIRGKIEIREYLAVRAEIAGFIKRPDVVSPVVLKI